MGHAARGATFIELLVVLTIAGLVGFLFLRTEPLGDRLALRAAAAEIVGELRRAQARALAERDPDRAYGLEFRAGAGGYTLFVRDRRVRSIIRAHRLPGRVRITYARFGGSPAGTIMFTGVSLLGAPSGGGTVTLSGGSARLCVRVLPATGRVRVTSTNCP